MLKRFFYKKSINQINFITITLAAVLTVIFMMVILITIYQEHISEIEALEEEYITSQREDIVHETKRALRYIEYKHKKDGKTKSVEDLKSEIVDAIEQMRDKRGGSGYIFIYTFEGVNVADPILKQNKGKNLINLKDPNGKKVIAELIEISKQKNGGFVEYIWNKPTVNKLAPKISYAIAYKPLGWMIGSGVYLDDIKMVINNKKREYSDRIRKYVLEILSLTALLFISGMIIYRVFTNLIKKEVDKIREDLKRAPIKCEGIDKESTIFLEFRDFIDSVNFMIDDIRENREQLEDLNKNLEQKVQEKTKKLQDAKEYVENLLEKQNKFIKTSIHEINTPLSIIIANIELFTMKVGRNSYLTKIEAASKVITNLFNDLSYVIKRDRLEYKKTILNFSEFLESRIDFFNEIAKGSNTEFLSEIDGNLYIKFNEVQLQRIIDNNLSNSIKYSKKGKNIEIALKEREEGVELTFLTRSETVIQEEKKVFGEFYRESSSKGGFGLGLKIVKDICDENSVIIEVSSNSERTIFTYTFKEES